jgi:hypothetical protein
MSGCPPFTFPINGDINQVLADVTAQARSRGFRFSGTLPSGSFSGMGVQGQYQVIGNNVTVTITSKGFAPCSMIENTIRDFFRA